MSEKLGNLEQLLKDPSTILNMCQVGKNILSKQQLLTGVDSLLGKCCPARSIIGSAERVPTFSHIPGAFYLF